MSAGAWSCMHRFFTVSQNTCSGARESTGMHVLDVGYAVCNGVAPAARPMPNRLGYVDRHPTLPRFSFC